MISLFRVAMSPGSIDLVSETLASGFTGQGPKVDLLESLLEKELGRKPLTVNSCTSAIDLALHLCGVGPGDEVISTPLTCLATQVGAYHRGARIRWADIDPFSGNIDSDSVLDLITPKTKAILAVDWAGQSCDYATLKKFGVPVIQDAAHVWDRPKDWESGDYVCYSLQAIKFLNAGGDGGLLIVPPEQYDRAYALKWYGWDRRQGNAMRCLMPLSEIGYKYHMNDVSASVAIGNLALAHENVQIHRRNAQIYDGAFQGMKSITRPPRQPGGSYWLYSILVQKGTKEEFMAFMKERGIETSPVHHRNDQYEATIQFQEDELPGVDYFSQRQVSIPVGWYLTQEDRDHIIKSVKEYEDLHN